MTLPDTRSLQRVGFILVRNFALMSYASAIEPLRAANLSLEGSSIASSSGIAVDCHDFAAHGDSCHTVFVCAGGGPADWTGTSVLHAGLRRLARQGVRIGGISSGSYVLAEAGLLNNRDFTIHWEHAPVLKETFPQLAPRQARFVIDGGRITCGGGVAPLDMMHAMIAERMGGDFARRVSDWFLHTAVAEPAAPQRGSAAERFGTTHAALLSILETMETTIEKPLDRSSMARFAGISSRHLDRLFREHRRSTFSDTYRDIRLRHARRLLEQSPLSISEIAYATGFSSAAHFTNCFKRLFGTTPKRVRR
jgi:transcriptional regulator GlxA family with amidase domain